MGAMSKQKSRFKYIAFLATVLVMWIWLGYFEAIEAPYVGF
jgi:hypothetical protein